MEIEKTEISKNKLYLLVKLIKEKASHKDMHESQKHNLIQQANAIDKILIDGVDQWIKELKEWGDKNEK